MIRILAAVRSWGETRRHPVTSTTDSRRIFTIRSSVSVGITAGGARQNTSPRSRLNKPHCWADASATPESRYRISPERKSRPRRQASDSLRKFTVLGFEEISPAATHQLSRIPGASSNDRQTTHAITAERTDRTSTAKSSASSRCHRSQCSCLRAVFWPARPSFRWPRSSDAHRCGHERVRRPDQPWSALGSTAARTARAPRRC